MFLRELEEKDAPFMLEWLNDPDITAGFTFYGRKFTLEDAQSYIKSARAASDVHMAVCDGDEYLGTVSLKDIGEKKGAEYAIVLRKKAQGSGAAAFATSEILKTAFEEYGLDEVYLNVLCENERAIRFYRRFGFEERGKEAGHFVIDGEKRDVLWFGITKEAFYKRDNA